MRIKNKLLTCFINTDFIVSNTAGLIKYKKGEGGRPPGTPNKLTATIRETFQKVFNTLQTDPKYAKNSLLAYAVKDGRGFYAMCTKLIPQVIEGEITKEITIKIERLKDKAPDSIIDIPHEVIGEAGNSI